MKIRLIILAAGALLVTGGKTVFGERNFESMPSNGSVYRVEEGYPMRGPNEFRMRETLNERDAHFNESSFEDHFREMERFHSEWDNLTEEERENPDIDTIGGWVVHLAGRMPAKGEVIHHEKTGMRFVIQSSNPSHIERLKIMAIPSKEQLQEIALKQEEED